MKLGVFKRILDECLTRLTPECVLKRYMMLMLIYSTTDRCKGNNHRAKLIVVTVDIVKRAEARKKRYYGMTPFAVLQVVLLVERGSHLPSRNRQDESWYRGSDVPATLYIYWPCHAL